MDPRYYDYTVESYYCTLKNPHIHIHIHPHTQTHTHRHTHTHTLPHTHTHFKNMDVFFDEVVFAKSNSRHVEIITLYRRYFNVDYMR